MGDGTATVVGLSLAEHTTPGIAVSVLGIFDQAGSPYFSLRSTLG